MGRKEFWGFVAIITQATYQLQIKIMLFLGVRPLSLYQLSTVKLLPEGG